MKRAKLPYLISFLAVLAFFLSCASERYSSEKDFTSDYAVTDSTAAQPAPSYNSSATEVWFEAATDNQDVKLRVLHTGTGVYAVITQNKQSWQGKMALNNELNLSGKNGEGYSGKVIYGSQFKILDFCLINEACSGQRSGGIVPATSHHAVIRFNGKLHFACARVY